MPPKLQCCHGNKTNQKPENQQTVQLNVSAIIKNKHLNLINNHALEIIFGLPASVAEVASAAAVAFVATVAAVASAAFAVAWLGP